MTTASETIAPPAEPASLPEPLTSTFQPPVLHSASGGGGSTRRKPTGKIAQLPKSQRDLINRMLEDGASYKNVEIEMVKHGVSLNGENISNWFDSGFQDYLAHQDWLAEMAALRESAGDLLDNYDPLQFHQAVNQLAVTQIFKSLGADKLADDPLNHTRALNAFSRLSREALVFKKYEDARAEAKALERAKLDPRRDLENERNLIFSATERAMGFPASPGPIGPDLTDYYSSSSSSSSSSSLAAPKSDEGGSSIPVSDAHSPTAQAA